MSLKERVPWQAKLVTKLAISRLPVPHAVWDRIGIYQHGGMQSWHYAEGVWRRHFEAATFGRKSGGFVCLELGPGDSLFTAILARLAGAEKTYLVDAGVFATADVSLYRDAASQLPGFSDSVLSPDSWSSIEAMMIDCHAEYLTGGLESLRSLPTGSVDFIFSHAVLEHVRRHEFAPMLRETRRLLRPDGYSSHVIDIRDHLGESLHSLRFPAKVWESSWFAKSGFYTNRLRYGEIVKIAEQAGFEVTTSETITWPTLPLAKSRLRPEYQAMDDDDLRVSSFTIVLTPNKAEAADTPG
jgi:SAM-dependent methyltransferase